MHPRKAVVCVFGFLVLAGPAAAAPPVAFGGSAVPDLTLTTGCEQFLPSGPVLHVLRCTEVFAMTPTAPPPVAALATGLLRLLTSYNLRFVTEPCPYLAWGNDHGTAEMRISATEVWEGIVEGHSSPDPGGTCAEKVVRRIVLHGRGGRIDGLTMRITLATPEGGQPQDPFENVPWDVAGVVIGLR